MRLLLGRSGRLLLIVAASFAVAFLAIRSTAIEMLPLSHGIAAEIAPSNPHVTLNQPLLDFRTLAPFPSVLAAALDAYPDAPLAFQPFLIAGLDALGKNDPRAHHLFLAARTRNPRARMVRLLALDGLLRRQQTTEAVQEIGTLSRLFPRASPILLADLSRRAQDPKMKPVIKQVLRSDRKLLVDLLQHLADRNPDPDLILDLAGAPSNWPFTGSRSSWQETLIRSLVAAGNYGQAHSLWKEFLPSNYQGGDDLLFNGSFRPIVAPAPFNWRFESGVNGIAEPLDEGGLIIEYHGRQRADLMEQVLTLAPGRYQFSVTTENGSGSRDSRLVWRLTCLPDRESLMELEFSGSPQEKGALSASFTVPSSGCTAQRISLRGIPGEFPALRSLTLRRASVTRLS